MSNSKPTTEKDLLANFPVTYNKLKALSKKEQDYILDFGDNCENSFKDLPFAEQIDCLADYIDKSKEIARLSKYEYIVLKCLYYKDSSINLLHNEWKNGIRQAGYHGGDINKHMQYLIESGLVTCVEKEFLITASGKKLFEKINFG